MDNQTKVIFALLILIAILGTIFVLKVTGIIKPAQKENIVIEEVVEEEIYSENVEFSWELSIKEQSKIEKKAKRIVGIIIILLIAINIGIAKLYRKIGMPNWTVNYQYIYIFIPTGLAVIATKSEILAIIMGLITAILSLVVSSHYFNAVGMPKLWAMVPLCSILSILGTAGSILVLGLWIAYLIAFIISNIRLAQMFNKGIGFTIGLAILPFVFQPILGYKRETV